MASFSCDKADFRPELDGTGITSQFNGLSSLDVIAQAEQIKDSVNASRGRKLLQRLSGIALRSANKQEDDIYTASTTLVHALQFATVKALASPEEHSTVTVGPTVSFNSITPGGSLYSVEATCREHDPGLPKDFKVSQYQNFQAKDPENILLENIKPDLTHVVSTISNNAALPLQTPAALTNNAHIYNMLSVATDLLEE